MTAPLRQQRPQVTDPLASFIARAKAKARPLGVPIATLWAAEFLLQQNDPQRFKTWLARHSESERAAILKHLEQSKKARAS